MTSLFQRLALAAIVCAAFAPRGHGAAFNSLPAFQAATSSLQHVNFDFDLGGRSTASGTDIGSTYAEIGLVFPPGNEFTKDFFGLTSPPNGWLRTLTAFFDVDVTAANVTAIGVHNVHDSGLPNGALLEAFNGPTLLASAMSDQVASTLDFFGVTTTQSITRATIRVPNATGWGLDDLYFGVVVPEPGTATGMLGGLACLIRSATRRRRG